MKFENDNFMNNTKSAFLECVQNGKKIILFGAGAEMKKAMATLLEPNHLKVAYAVDNDFRKWYSRNCGIEIVEPDHLKEEKDIVVLITSLYPYRIEKQLKRLKVDCYFSSLLFVEEHIGKQQFIVMF